MSVVKNIYHVIADPLTFIYNLSLTSGVFPDEMKIAKVIPLFKSGDKNVYTNYRPVSLLPQFSKVLEKVFSKRLNSFLELLSNNQYGFRNKRSTSQALLHLIEKLTKSLDNKTITVGVFIDFKKAFDTIDHSLLLNKLEYYGIKGVALNWLQSYLSNRKQFVTVNGIDSKNLNVKCGVLLRSDGRHGYEWAKIGDFINLTFYLTRGNAKNSVLKLKFILFYFNLMILGVFCGI